MATDFTKYIDLTIFDEQPGDIYLNSIEQAQLTLPEFNLRIGTPEDAIFQAAAYIGSLHVAAINRLPNRLMAGILAMTGVVRQPAIQAEVDITITAETYDGGNVTAGTIFGYQTIFEDEIQELIFQTNNLIVIPSVASPSVGTPLPSASATVTCVTPGVIPVVPTPGAEMRILSSGTNILSAVTLGNFANGLNGDTDSEYLSRAVTHLQSLSSSINKSSQIDSYLLLNYQLYAERVKAYDLTYGDSSLGDVSVARTKPISNVALTSQSASVSFSSAHQFIVGDKVTISNCSNAVFDGTHTITATNSTVMVFTKVNANIASTAATGTATAGADQAGYVTIFAYGINQFITNAIKNQMLADIQKVSSAGLTFHIRDPFLVSAQITSTVVISSEFNQALLEELIENTIINYLSPQVFPFTDDRIRQTKLISLISSIPGVLYVQSLSLTGSGQNPDGFNSWLPKIDEDIVFSKKGSLPLVGVNDLTITYVVASE